MLELNEEVRQELARYLKRAIDDNRRLADALGLDAVGRQLGSALGELRDQPDDVARPTRDASLPPYYRLANG